MGKKEWKLKEIEEECELLVPAKVLQVFTKIMFSQQGRAQEDLIKELHAIHKRVQQALYHFGVSTNIRATSSEIAEEEMRRGRPPGFTTRARREEMLRKRNIMDTIHEVLQISIRRESLLDEVSDWLYDVQMALAEVLSSEEDMKAMVAEEAQIEKHAYLSYNDGKRLMKKTGEKFRNISREIFDTMNNMANSAEGNLEMNSEVGGNFTRQYDVAGMRMNALKAKLAKGKDDSNEKHLAADAADWRAAAVEVKKALDDSSRLCQTNNDRTTMKNATKQFDFMNLVMERRTLENSEFSEQILEGEVKINHLEILNEKMDAEVREQSRRITSTERTNEKQDARFNELRKKLRDTQAEMEKVKKAEIFEAMQAEAQKANQASKQALEEEKAKFKKEIQVLQAKLVNQEAEFSEKVAKLEATTKNDEDSIMKLNVALDNLEDQLNDALEKQDEYANQLDISQDQSEAKQSSQDSIREQYKQQLKIYKEELDLQEKELDKLKETLRVKEEIVEEQDHKLSEAFSQLNQQVGKNMSAPSPKEIQAPPESLNEFHHLSARMKGDYEFEIHKLQEHVAKEKQRAEADIRRQTHEVQSQLHSIYKESLHLLRSINRFKESVTAIFEKEGLADLGHELKQMQNLSTDEKPTDMKTKLNQMGGNAVEMLVFLEIKVSQAFMNKRLDLKEVFAPRLRAQISAPSFEVNAEIEKLTTENEGLTEKLTKAQDMIAAGEVRCNELKKINDEKYKALLDRHKDMIVHSSNLQREFTQLEEAFKREMKKRDFKLLSMEGSLAEQAKNQQVLISQLEMETVMEEPEKIDIGQLKIKVKDQMKNLSMLEAALKENKISLELHTITVDIIKQALEVPEMRLRQLFERYIMHRRILQQKEEMFFKVEAAGELGAEKKNKIASFLQKMDTRMKDSINKWEEKRELVKQERTKIYEQLLAIFDAVGQETGISMIRPKEKLKIIKQQTKRKKPVLPSRQTGIHMKLPMEFKSKTLRGTNMTLIGDRGPYWKVPGDWEGATPLITIPKMLDYEVNSRRQMARDVIKRLAMGDVSERGLTLSRQQPTLPPVATLFPPLSSKPA